MRTYGAGSATVVERDDGSIAVHCNATGWGIGAYTWRDESAEAAAKVCEEYADLLGAEDGIDDGGPF
jgi:hypothetical protein